MSGLEPQMTKLSPQNISRNLEKHWAKVHFCLHFPRPSQDITKLKEII